MSNERGENRQPPGDDALDGFTRGSAEPFPVGGSRRETFKPLAIHEQIRKINKDDRLEVGDLVWCWSLWQEEFRMYELTNRCTHGLQIVWHAIDMETGLIKRLKRVDVWLPKV